MIKKCPECNNDVEIREDHENYKDIHCNICRNQICPDCNILMTIKEAGYEMWRECKECGYVGESVEYPFV
jgi:DNA-directed RNA polymerase subunit M/transcription elongation factor TFIIS